MLPMLNPIESGYGVSLIQSPEDTPIVAFATASRGRDGAFLNYTRLYHRLGGNAEPFVATAQLLAHGADWKNSAGWLKASYPEFFLPNTSTLKTMERISGAGSFAGASHNLLTAFLFLLLRTTHTICRCRLERAARFRRSGGCNV